MADQGYNLKYTGKEIDDLLDKAKDMNSSAQVPTGGYTGQVLAKKTNSNYDVGWVDQTGGGSSGESDLFVIKVTGTSSSNFAADKTYDEMVAAYQAGKAVIMVPKDMAIDSSTYQTRLRCLPLSQLYSIVSTSSSTGITTTREYASFASPYINTSMGTTHSTIMFTYIIWSRTSKSDGTVSESISNSTGSAYTIPYGGKTGQLLAKKDDNSYSFNMQWIDPPSGGSSGVSTSVIVDSYNELPGSSRRVYTFDALNNGDKVIVLLQRESGLYTTNEYTWYGEEESKLMVCHPNDNQGATIFGRAYLESTQIVLAQTAWWAGYEYTGALSNNLVTGYKVIVARYS